VLRNDGTLSDVGNIYDILQLDENKAPVDYSSVKILAKSLPVVMYLGYFIGLKNILKMLNMEYRYIEPRKQKNLEKHEFAVTFLDGSYVFSKKDKTAASVVAGLLEYEKELKAYSFDELNNKDVYLNLLNAKGMSSFYIREMENIQQLFVDPISKDLLEEMKEPTTFNGLLIRATEMLQSYDHPDSQDTKYMRIRGYERFAGIIYRQVADSIRSYKHRNIAGKSKIEMSPYDIWQTIMKDPAVKLVEDINPIQNLKESEIVTYVGVGGRDKGSMNKASRAYHKNDMGVVSEATVDSSDVGINAYLSANPKFKNLRGLIDDTEGVTPSNLVSTSALLAVGADKDDFKRVNKCSLWWKCHKQTSLIAGNS
ncbi:MAG: hypothetical protein M0Q87_14675, partial [Ottowia sp.]|nr:hypothetical protein [Ottowia sp.]